MTATMLSFTKTLDEATIHMAMQGVTLELAGDVAVAFDADNELAALARTPVSLASAYADLCAMLGMAPPAFVLTALD
jgi:hypothetical protein